MPWIGVTEDGERVIPEEVAGGAYVTCPTCERKMYPRGPTADGKARHFAHMPGEEIECSSESVGESELHRKWKSLVLSGIRQWFSEYIDHSEPEVTLDASGSTTPVDIRRADVYIDFDPEHPVFGDGLLVEVQHKNRTKDCESVNHDYVVLGYSIYWADESDFTDDRFRIHNMIKAFQTPSYGQRDAIIASEATPLEFDPVPDEHEPTTTMSSTESEEPKLRIARNEPAVHSQHEGIPLRDDDSHVVPHLPDCRHNLSQSKANLYTCGKCNIEIYRYIRRNRSGEKWQGNFVQESDGLLSERFIRKARRAEPGDAEEADEDEFVPECDDRLWLINSENDTYACTICEKEFPQSIDELRDRFT